MIVLYCIYAFWVVITRRIKLRSTTSTAGGYHQHHYWWGGPSDQGLWQNALACGCRVSLHHQIYPHMCAQCVPLCLLANKTRPWCSAVCLFVMQGVQWSPNTDLGVTWWPKFAEARTATARTRPDRSFHGMMDQALKLLLSSSTAARSAD